MTVTGYVRRIDDHNREILFVDGEDRGCVKVNI